MAVLPFILIIRGSVFLYNNYEWNHWLALIAMFAVAFVILMIYTTMIYDWIIGANKVTRTGLKIQSVLVVSILFLYGGYTLINLSGANAKTEEVILAGLAVESLSIRNIKTIHRDGQYITA